MVIGKVIWISLKIKKPATKKLQVLYFGGESDYPLQHLQELFRIIREIYKNKKLMDDNLDSQNECK